MIQALGFKSYEKGSLRGFCDVEYYGIIFAVRIMTGKDGLWVAYPSQKYEKDGSVEWKDTLDMSSKLREHLRRSIIGQLVARGDIPESGHKPKPSPKPKPSSAPRAGGPVNKRLPGQEQLNQYYSNPADDQIPF